MRAFALSAVLVASLFASTAGAAIRFSVTSSADPSNLRVGDDVAFTVSVSGVPSTGLELLSASLRLPSDQFGTPTQITAGSIVPNPLFDALDFQTIAADGFADLSFATNATTPAQLIHTDGVFGVVHVRALAAGTGEVRFDFVDALSHDAANPNTPSDPGTVADAPVAVAVAVPEPACAAAIALLLGSRRRR